jgi:hypothetical protein
MSQQADPSRFQEPKHTVSATYEPGLAIFLMENHGVTVKDADCEAP